MEQSILVGAKEGLYEISGERPVNLLVDHDVTALARADSGWMAIVDGSGEWKSEDGSEWSEVAKLEGYRANCILPTESGALIGTSEAHLFELRDHGFRHVESFDQAPGRETWYTPWGGPPDVRSISAAPSGAVYANVHVGGVLRSPDGGASWQPTMDIDADVHQVLFDPGSGLLLAASARGLGVSEDAGESWRFDTEGLHGKYLRAVAVAGDTLLLTASTGHASSRAAVYRRPVDGGGAFQRCADGLPEWFPSNIDTSCLATSGPVAAFGTSQGLVFMSSDAGKSWRQAADGLGAISCVALP